MAKTAEEKAAEQAAYRAEQLAFLRADVPLCPAEIHYLDASTGAEVSGMGEGVLAFGFSYREQTTTRKNKQTKEDETIIRRRIAVVGVGVAKAQGNRPFYVVTKTGPIKGRAGSHALLGLAESGASPGHVVFYDQIGRQEPSVLVTLSGLMATYAQACIAWEARQAKAA